MSKKINVNPDHYKVAGRERQGEGIVHGPERQAYAQQQAHADRWQAKQREAALPEAAPPEREIARRITVKIERPTKKTPRAAPKRTGKAKKRGKSAPKGRAKARPVPKARKPPARGTRAAMKKKPTRRRRS